MTIRHLKTILILSGLILTGAFSLWYFPRRGTTTPTQSNVVANTPSSNEVVAAKALKDINKTFTFPILDEEGENELTRFSLELVSAEKRDEILVKGQKASAIPGRTFLILNLKITNSFGSGFEIDTKDYFRLAVNGNTEEWLAPDIHNDPVTVQAISTKMTRIGFPVNDADTQLLLRVGEISGEKEDLALEI